MINQLDMFAACTPTLPPHLDPARACGIRINADQFPDTDAGYKAATARENELQTILSRNRQAMLF